MKNINIKLAMKKGMFAIKSVGKDSDKDWKLFFLLFICVSIIVTIVHIQLFLETSFPDKSGAPALASNSELIDSKALSDLITKYDERAKSYAEISTSTSSIVDPER